MLLIHFLLEISSSSLRLVALFTSKGHNRTYKIDSDKFNSVSTLVEAMLMFSIVQSVWNSMIEP